MPIGPLTNIAAAVAQEPKFAEWVPELIIMGGGHEVGNMTPSAEFNIWADPEAAASVFEAGFKNILMVPLFLLSGAIMFGAIPFAWRVLR